MKRKKQRKTATQPQNIYIKYEQRLHKVPVTHRLQKNYLDRILMKTLRQYIETMMKTVKQTGQIILGEVLLKYLTKESTNIGMRHFLCRSRSPTRGLRQHCTPGTSSFDYRSARLSRSTDFTSRLSENFNMEPPRVQTREK